MGDQRRSFAGWLTKSRTGFAVVPGLETEGFPEVDLVGGLSNRQTQARLRRLADRLGQADSRMRHRPAARKPLRRPGGSILAAIAVVLSGIEGGMRARDIHAAVQALLGEPVPVSSVKDCLARNARGKRRRLDRVAWGRYRVRDIM
jgi:hypothetical protein